MHRLLVLSLLLALPAVAQNRVQLKDEGVSQGYVSTLDCVGSSVSCTRSSSTGTITITGGGGGGLPDGGGVGADIPVITWQSWGDLTNEYVLAAGSNVSIQRDAGSIYVGVTGVVPAAYAADASISAQYLALTCGGGQYVTCSGSACTCSTPAGSAGKVAESYMADASITAQTATSATTATTAALSYSADASYFAVTAASATSSSSATVAGTAYSTDASYSSIVSGTAATAFSTDASYRSLFAATSDVTYSADASYWSFNARTAYSADASYSSSTSADLTCTGCVAVAELSATGTPSATTYLRGDGTWSTPGGGGTPGGSTSDIQYNAAGSFGGVSRVESDGTDLILVGTTTHASAPAATKATIQSFQHSGASGPGILHLVTPELGFDVPVEPRPFVRSDEAVWGCVIPSGYASATYNVDGRAQAGTATGTAASPGAWAATDARTRMAWVSHPAAATTNTNAGLRAPSAMLWRGSSAGLGGWYWQGSFSLNSVTAAARVFVGLRATPGTVLSATSDPNTALDTVYIGANSADANLSICSNDATTTATCTTLGASFPKSSTKAYDVAFWSAANGSTIGYWIRDIVVGTEATGTLSTDLPRNTIQLGWDFNINTAGTATASTLWVGGSCWFQNP